MHHLDDEPSGARVLHHVAPGAVGDVVRAAHPDLFGSGASPAAAVAVDTARGARLEAEQTPLTGLTAQPGAGQAGCRSDGDGTS